MNHNRVLLSLTLCLFQAVSLFGQATSSLRGKIVDSQGALIPGAAIQLLGDQTGFRRSVLSDEAGTYQFAQVPPGVYQLVVEMPGFAVITRSGLQLAVGTTASLDVTLEVANLSETVSVEAEAVTLNTVDATIGNAFNQLQVRQLPLVTRNVVELLSLQPGVTTTGEVVGAKRDQNNVTLDGVDVNDNQTAGLEGGGSNGFNTGSGRGSGFNAALPVPLDSVQEFRVTIGAQNSNQGRSSGGQVTLVTKSGTNQFHGSAYEYNRNTLFSANNWFNNRAGVAREALNRNQFGGSLGGPIVKDRVFFFGNFERRIDASGSTQVRRVASDSLRQGILMARTNDGAVLPLTPDQLKVIDPLHIGVSPAMLALFQQMPAGNDPLSGADRGLNFTGFRFNAPMRLDNKAYVAKFDFRLDRAGLHSLSLRGTLADNMQDDDLARYPGQTPASRTLNNSRGASASYTAVLDPALVNVFNFGITRIGQEKTGSREAGLTHDSIDSLVNYTRGYIRIAPTYNIADDMTWTRGNHTLSFGGNFRVVRNNRTNFNTFASYGFGRGSLGGLGADIITATENYLAAQTGNSGIRLSDGSNVTRALGDIYGVVTGASTKYYYTREGQPLLPGTAVVRQFASNEWELYFGDSWRMKPNLTMTYGLRYTNYGVPYEQKGMQVAPIYPIQDFRAERWGTMNLGIPSNALPHARMSYDFIGPANGKDSWYKQDNNNFGPRLAFAYSSPDGEGIIGKLLGKNGVIRGGGSILFDRYGSDLITQFDNAASFGLTETQNLGFAPNFTTGPRYHGVLPEIAPGSTHTFPFTPGDVTFYGSNYMGISTDLHAPYSMVFNMSLARELPAGLTVEASYAGRLSRAGLMQIDAGGWALLFKDQKSGIIWKEMAQTMRGYKDAGIEPRAVRANPSLIPPNPFIENQFPGLKDLYFPGSASANYYDLLWGQYAGSDADTMHGVDRVRSDKFPNCISITGCFTFFPVQSSGNSMWTNIGFASYNGGTLSIRKPYSRGFSFDINCTLSHSIDNGGAPESGGGTGGGIMLSPYNYSAFRGSSDFDVRHNLNANALYDLPFGRDKLLLSGVPGWLDQIVGGWQFSTITRYRSGLPTAVAYGGIWPTNFSFTTVAYAVAPYEAKVGFNEFGAPSIFSSTKQAANWRPMLPGEVGTRASVRLDDLINTDLSVTKVFNLPVENHRLEFRAEAFNAFNNVNFTNVSLDANSPASFGQFSQTTQPRVMQFALRYEF